jgi:hypothetical protein
MCIADPKTGWRFIGELRRSTVVVGVPALGG